METHTRSTRLHGCKRWSCCPPQMICMLYLKPRNAHHIMWSATQSWPRTWRMGPHPYVSSHLPLPHSSLLVRELLKGTPPFPYDSLQSRTCRMLALPLRTLSPPVSSLPLT